MVAEPFDMYFFFNGVILIALWFYILFIKATYFVDNQDAKQNCTHVILYF